MSITTRQTARSSIFNIKVDLSQSHGSYLYDVTTHRKVLDLFCMYSSLPLGYNHSIFNSEEFVQDCHYHLGVKVTNCEMNTDATEKFVAAFTEHASMRPFSHFHFCCTGALAIEAAVKTVIKARGLGMIGTFENNFHGINGYGGLLASGDGPAAERLRGFRYGTEAHVFDNPTLTNRIGLLKQIESMNSVLSAIIVEPIQCTSGDYVINVDFLKALRLLCDASKLPIIFDEIQTGFGGTGTMWYFEQLGFTPDIVVFGKKTQVSGIMAREQFAKIFEQPNRLEVTWDGDVLDMIRCTAILNEYERSKVLDNVKWRGDQFDKGLRNILNFRRAGLLIAIDFESHQERDLFVKSMWEDEATIMIPTGEKCVRWRPNLAITAAEVNDAIRRTQRVLRTVAA